MDEQKLIELATRGDLDSFNELVVLYQDKVFNTAFRILGEEASAEDATQTAFINAFRSIRQYRGGSFKSWLFRTVTNACYDELRRQKRRPSVPLEPAMSDAEEEMDSPAWLADNSSNPQELSETREIEQAVQRCIQALPDEFRMIVVLVDIQGLNYAEASSAIGKPLGTIKSRLARARLRLRHCLNRVLELLQPDHRLDNESDQ